MAAVKRYYDADGHIFESDEELRDFIEEPFKGVDGRYLPSLDQFHTLSKHQIGRDPEMFRPADASRWLEFLDRTNIEWTVLYPSWGLAFGKIVYPEWAAAYARAYNNWLHEKFLRVSPRLKGIALIPMQDPALAVEELRRAVTELGMVGGMIPSTGLNPHISAKFYWPIYEEAERLDCVLSVHGGGFQDLGFNTFTAFSALRALGMPIPLMIALTGLIVDGVLEAFPRLRVGFLEGGTAWVPVVLDRLKREMEYGEFKGIRDPEEYFRQQRLYVGCEGNEKALSYAIERIGYESVVFASDFPHEITMENCTEEIDEILTRGDLQEEHKLAILGENARKFYKA